MPRPRKKDKDNALVERANLAASYREIARMMPGGHSRERLLEMAAKLDAESSRENGGTETK
jgi:hypothetical protein